MASRSPDESDARRSRSTLEALPLAYVEAVQARSACRLAAIYDPAVRVFDLWERWSYEGLPAWRSSLDAWLGALDGEDLRVRFDDVIADTRDDLGYLTAGVTYAAVDLDGHVLRSMQNRLTWIAARTDDGWTIVHEHTSAPISSEDQRAVLQRR